ncbi:hypothetical protein RoPhRRH1_gp16 [Rhodococcus phage RRH1]|uniref:Uncharacterized protein n=1 Tax=Rhodococcus phage RRH1 TaxID=1109717 RepID=G9FGW1_9CAUD|nr:hypothetical protein RoPhRRH1_gp16 [Rhodococcus phage RRH1]AEV51850.1 hypothetical protein [Rhodococcus phage RRH1]
MSTVRNPRPGIRYDKRGRMIPARSSGVHCEECGIVFALGFLPMDGGRICRECRTARRGDQLRDRARDPALFPTPRHADSP